MHRDEVTTPWHGPGYSNNGATRNSKFAVPDSRTPGDETLSFSLDEWQTFTTEVQAMTPYSLSARAGRRRGGSLRCHHRMTTAAKSPEQAAARMNH